MHKGDHLKDEEDRVSSVRQHGAIRFRIEIAGKMHLLSRTVRRTKMFPYAGCDLTQLEGFEPTELELAVAGNPSFQALRGLGSGKLIRWGELATGFRENPSYLRGLDVRLPRAIPAENDALAPRTVSTILDSGLKRLRSVVILAAKIRRDAAPDSDVDQQLLRDLGLWIDGSETFEGFRWEIHWQSLRRSAQYATWQARAEELQQGTAEVVVFLRHRLQVAEMQSLAESLEQEWLAKEFPGALEQKPRILMERHYPFMRCLRCGNEQARHRNFGAGGQELCRSSNAAVVVDPKSTTDVIAQVPRRLQRLCRIVRFRIPRNTFRVPGDSKHDMVFPQMLVFGLEQLSVDQRQETYQRITSWLEGVRSEEPRFWRGGQCEDYERRWQQQTVLAKPYRSRHLNCLLLAGPQVEEWAWFEHPFDAINRGTLSDLLADLPITVSAVHKRWLMA